MKFLWISLLISVLILGCKDSDNTSSNKQTVLDQGVSTQFLINLEGDKISERFDVPEGYARIAIDSPSFGHYLRNLPLKDVGEKVKYYDGSTKDNKKVYDAVVDLPIGKRDLHQCADAVIRLRAEYFFGRKKYDSIHFNFTNGFRADYDSWKNGKRIVVNDNDVRWKQSAPPSNSYQTFWKYLEMVFSYAGTASLEKEMKSVHVKEVKIGDVFIKGGFPGHAVIVVDMAKDKTSGKKIFLLAQSYMPAQEIQVLKNPNDNRLSPWYSSEISSKLRTPEWTFERTRLKRF
ncbi:MAG: DUF4846 domain-containing protein [Aurantibacter sp.]